MRDNTPSRHHIRAKSRNGGRRHNIVMLPSLWHSCYHHLFGALTVAEVHVFIDEVMRPDTEWTYKQLSELRKRISGGHTS